MTLSETLMPQHAKLHTNKLEAHVMAADAPGKFLVHLDSCADSGSYMNFLHTILSQWFLVERQSQ